MLNQSAIENIVKTIVDGYTPEKIILFGSYANGNANNESDLDLLIIKKTSEKQSRRSRQVRYLFSTQEVAMDILVFTPEEIIQLQNNKYNIVSIALNNGINLYERAC